MPWAPVEIYIVRGGVDARRRDAGNMSGQRVQGETSPSRCAAQQRYRTCCAFAPRAFHLLIMHAYVAASCLDGRRSICKARMTSAGAAKKTRNHMTTFDKREEGFEKQFAHDEELKFKATARRNKMLGLWAAEKLGLSGPEADSYALSVVMTEFEQTGERDVSHKIRK